MGRTFGRAAPEALQTLNTGRLRPGLAALYKASSPSGCGWCPFPFKRNTFEPRLKAVVDGFIALPVQHKPVSE
jgi:hypothetical protein